MKSLMTLKSTRIVATLALIGLATTAALTPARAGTDVDLRAGFYTDADAVAIGGGLLTSLGSFPGWFFNPNIEVAMPDGGNLVTLNGDFHYDFPTGGSISPYVGAGAALLHTEDDTNLGMNVLAGLSGLTGAVRPFVQLKGVFGNGNDVALMGGVRF